MDSLLKTRALVAAVNALQTSQTLVLDMFFGTKKPQATDRFAWDIKTGSVEIMKNLKVFEPASVTSVTGRTTVTCSAPRFAEKRPIYQADINALRAFGDQVATELMKNKIADELFDMRNKIDRTREFMAAKALTGTIVDQDGNSLVDFNMPDAHKPDASPVWDNAEGDPVGDIRDWKKLITQKVGNVTQWKAICGFEAMNALFNNESVVALMAYQKGAQIAEDGRISRLAGVDIYEYMGGYKDSSGTYQDFIAEDQFILVGMVQDAMMELYCPAVEPDASADLYFSKSWVTEDPACRWIKAESRPLPVVSRPECIVCATVV